MNRFRYQIGFIGAGHLGGVLLESLLAKRLFRPGEIAVSTAHRATRLRLARKHRIAAPQTNRELVRTSRTVLLAVRPQQMNGVLREIRGVVTPHHLIITIAAGLDLASYRRALPGRPRLIRAMPNRAIRAGSGITALFGSKPHSSADRRLARRLFSASGDAFFVEREAWFDAITALSACGIAFVFLFLLALSRGGRRGGLPLPLSRQLALKTATGALRLLEAPGARLEEEIRRVASKGGTTEAGLRLFRKRGFVPTVEAAVAAAIRRARELRHQR